MATEPQNHVSGVVAVSNERDRARSYDNLDYDLYSALQIIGWARQQMMKRERIYQQHRVETQALLQKVYDLQDEQKELVSDCTRAIQNQEEMMKINQSLELQLEEAEVKEAVWKQQHRQLLQSADLDSAQVEGLEQVVEQQARDLLVLKAENERTMSLLLKHYPNLLGDGSNLSSILENENENGRKRRRRSS